MEWVEISAKTIEEAKDKALDRLGVDERDAEFEILDEPRVGIFGRMKGEARVRARVKPTAPRAKADGRGRKRAERADKPAAADKPARAPRATKKPAAARDAEVVDDESPVERVEVEDAVDTAPPARAPRAPRVRSEESRISELEDLSLEQQTGVVTEVVQGLVEVLQLDATVASRGVDDETAEVAVSGSQLGFLVGPRGRTLHALNEITRSIVLRRGDVPPSARVHVDVAGYRQRRRDALAAFSTATAEQVRSTGLAHALEPMGSGDRKVVHDTIAELDGVASLSEGEDHERRVVIVPA